VNAQQSRKEVEAADGMAQSSGIDRSMLLIRGMCNKKMLPKQVEVFGMVCAFVPRFHFVRIDLSRHPKSLAMRLVTHRKGGPVSLRGFRRRDADGGGRDDRAPQEVANDWGAERRFAFFLGLAGRVRLTWLSEDKRWMALAAGAGLCFKPMARLVA